MPGLCFSKRFSMVFMKCRLKFWSKCIKNHKSPIGIDVCGTVFYISTCGKFRVMKNCVFLKWTTFNRSFSLKFQVAETALVQLQMETAILPEIETLGKLQMRNLEMIQHVQMVYDSDNFRCPNDLLLNSVFIDLFHRSV